MPAFFCIRRAALVLLLSLHPLVVLADEADAAAAEPTVETVVESSAPNDAVPASSATPVETEVQPSPKPERKSTDALEAIKAKDNLMQDSLMDLIISMLAVVALIIAVVWMLRKVPGMHRGAGRSLRFVDGLSVGQRERVVIVEVEGRRVLLGVASGSVTFLQALDQDTTTAATSSAGAEATSDPASAPSTEPEPEPSSPSSASSRFQQQLKQATQQFKRDSAAKGD